MEGLRYQFIAAKVLAEERTFAYKDMNVRIKLAGVENN